MHESVTLILAAAAVGLVHTLLGPDHYVPFVALARARRWSVSQTLGVTLACGGGHVAGSILLGLLGVFGGWALTDLVNLEAARGELAGWLLLGFGMAYLVWGLRRAMRSRRHAHWHTHGDGTIHQHEHNHHAAHAHVHGAEGEGPSRITPWILFVIFVFGPCEPLIPVFLYPAAQKSWGLLVMVVLAFAIATLATMTTVVLIGYRGAHRLEHLLPASLRRYGHALAGAALAACGVVVSFGL